MRMFDINGKMVKVDIRESRHPVKARSRSLLQGEVGQVLVERFPRQTVLEDFTIPGSRLSVDFFMPNAGIVIEIDGRQHSEYIPFFHGDRNQLKFSDQITRDMKKQQWCDYNSFTMIRIANKEDIEKIDQI